MKIGINATVLHDKPSGLGIYTINIIKELSKIIGKEHSIIVYTSNAEIFKDCNVEVRLVPKQISSKYGKVGGGLRFLWSQFVFPSLLKKDKIDLIYSSTHHGTFFTNIPQILTIHDLLAIVFPNQHKLQYYYFKYITPLLLKKTKGIVTVSNNTKKDLEKEYNCQDVQIVYNSYDINHFVKKENSKCKAQFGDYILFIGASYPHKNLKKAIEAFLSLREEYPNLKFVIAGGQKVYRDGVIDSFKEKGIALNNIEIIDYVSFTDLPKIYSGAVALLYPSMYEGFGIPPIEAMACGCPVVVSNTSSLPEVCGNAAVYIDPQDIASIKNGMKKVLDDKNYRKSLVHLGFENIKRFRWEKSAKDLLNYLETKGR